MRGKRSSMYLDTLESLLIVREEKRDDIERRFQRQLVSEETYNVLMNELKTEIDLLTLTKGIYLASHDEEPQNELEHQWGLDEKDRL